MTKKSREYDTWVPDIFIRYATKNRKKFYSLELEFDRSQIDQPFVVYLGSLLFYFLILCMFYLLVIFYIFSNSFTSFRVIDFILSLGFFFVVAPLSFLVLYSHPRVVAFLNKIRIDPEIEKVAEIFIQELDKGKPSTEVFKTLASSDLKAASKEFKYIVYLIEKERVSLLKAIMTCAKQTPSDKFREFLHELNLTIRTESALRRTLRKYAKR
ncbi:MAG: hypothetical protein JSW73_03385 [Candidatus Woesearchaeota archaeon]|nr:MAG: hypothetical protein JSW73_03385 [Candidatus Woesearchaeota archaeon]